MVRDDSRGEAARDELHSAMPEGERNAPACPTHDVTRILSRIEQGEPQAAEQLLPLVYEELRKLATVKMAQERPDQTLQATALVHESYIRLVDVDQVQHWDSRGHFFAAAAEAMRRILVDRARHKETQRAGGLSERVDLDHSDPLIDGPSVDLIALNEALEKLAQRDPRKAELVKLRFFAGLSVHEAADVLGIAVSTAIADWAYAKGWLCLEMSGEASSRGIR
jgi:RNA polymerase sigma factor (TIGR02999 family)